MAAHQPGGEFLNFFLVLWRILHSSSTCRGISELLIALVSSSCHPGSHHFGIFGPIIYVCPPGGAVHTTGFGPVGMFPRLAQRIPSEHSKADERGSEDYTTGRDEPRQHTWTRRSHRQRIPPWAIRFQLPLRHIWAERTGPSRWSGLCTLRA